MKTNIESYDIVHQQNIGQGRMLWYYPNTLEHSVNGLVALIIMCDVMAPIMKLENSEGMSDKTLSTLGKHFTTILELAKNARDIDLQIANLQKTVTKVQQKASNQRTIIEHIVTTCEDVLSEVFHQIPIDQTNCDTIEEEINIESSATRKRKSTQPKNRATKVPKCLFDIKHATDLVMKDT
jgi:hypothetical protein